MNVNDGTIDRAVELPVSPLNTDRFSIKPSGDNKYLVSYLPYRTFNIPGAGVHGYSRDIHEYYGIRLIEVSIKP